jgi:simple sugar transport system permease protein
MEGPRGGNYPQTAEFAPGAVLLVLGGTRVHLGLAFAIVAVAAFAFVLAKTRWGLEMRAMGGNAEAARRAGIPVGRYVVVLMFLGGGLAGLAGMAEVSAIQGRLRSSLSPRYGYTGS